MEKQDSFAVTYGIDPIEYAEDEIESANFSVRTFGILKNNGIDTVAGLLRETEVDLLSIKGFGRNSCDEVIKYVKTLRQSMNSGNQKSKVIRRQPYWAREQKELLFAGRFEHGNIILLKLAGMEKFYGVGNWY